MKGERRWHIETFRARWLRLATSLLYKTGATLVTCDNMFESTGGINKQLHQFRPFCNPLKTNGDRHVAYSLILGASWPAQCGYFFFLTALHEYFFWMDHNDFYLNVLLPLIFTCTFMLHCLRGQTRAIPSLSQHEPSATLGLSTR